MNQTHWQKVTEVLLNQIDILKAQTRETETVVGPRVQLYCDPRSTCSRSVLAVLHERGCEFELNVVDLAKQEQKSAAHPSVQPFGKVPVLRNGERTLYESKVLTLYET